MRIRQIVIAAQDLAASRERIASVFGLDQPFRDPGVAEFGIDNAVFVFGDQFIEVISPVRPDTACGRHLARHGDGGYMLLLQTDDLARERRRWADLGVRSVWSADLADIRANHLHPKDLGGAIVSVDQPQPSASWRWGGPGWQVRAGRAGVQRVRGLSLRASDPAAMARRWAQVLGLADPVPAAGGWRLALNEGFADFEAGPEGIAGFTLEVADRAAVLDAAHAAGARPDAQGFELLGLRWTVGPVAVPA